MIKLPTFEMEQGTYGDDEEEIYLLKLSDEYDQELINLGVTYLYAEPFIHVLDEHKSHAPFIYRLACNFLRKLGGFIEMVQIDEFKDSLLYATIHYSRNSTDFSEKVDIFDALLITIITGSMDKLFIDEDVLAEYRSIHLLLRSKEKLMIFMIQMNFSKVLTKTRGSKTSCLASHLTQYMGRGRVFPLSVFPKTL